MINGRDRKELEKALKEKIRELVRGLDDQLLITLPAQWESWEYDRKGYAGSIPEIERVDGVIREKLERFYDLEELKEVFTRRELDSWIYSIAEEEAGRRSLNQDRLYEIEEWPVGDWRRGYADLGSYGELEVRELYYNPQEGKAYIFADLYLEPESLKEQGWVVASSSEMENLKEVYSRFAGGEIDLKDYLKALKPYLPEDFDFEAVKLQKYSYGQNALYPVVFDINESGELGEVVAEGREALRWIEKNTSSPEVEENTGPTNPNPPKKEKDYGIEL